MLLTMGNVNVAYEQMTGANCYVCFIYAAEKTFMVTHGYVFKLDRIITKYMTIFFKY